MQVREAVIVDTGRTAIGKRKGALANWHPPICSASHCEP